MSHFLAENDPVQVAARAYEDIKGHESMLCQDKAASQVLTFNIEIVSSLISTQNIETLFKKSSSKQLLEFLDRLQGHYTAVAVTPFGSHVLETFLAALQAFFPKFSKSDAKLAATNLQNFFKVFFLLKLYLHLHQGYSQHKQELDPHLEEWLQDPFATFVLRALFRFLSGSAASVKRDQHQPVPAPAAAQSVR